MFKDTLLDNLTIGILVLDNDLKTIYLNKKMKNILKEQNIDKKYFNFSIKNFNTIENYKIKTYEIKKNKKKFIQMEFHETIERSEYKLVTMLDTVQDFIFYLDSKGRIEYFNEAYANYLGKSYLEIIGKKESEFFPKEMAEKCEANNRKALDNGNFYEEENFQGRWYQTFKSRVDLGNNSYGILGMVKEITASKKKTLDLKEKVYKDILTGIYNRNFYEEKMNKLLENKKTKIFSMMLLDIDKFKKINDDKGHDVGDLVLKKIAEILKRNVRKSNDFVIRIGGDELAVIIDGNLKELEKILKRVEKDILKENLLGDLKFNISVGLAEREQEENLNNLYKKADIELYKMKYKKQGATNESNKVI
ncbi:MAG: diguanylate cyclase [Cetobacterium sp.]|uniref:diguanylate cyclase n=1 Tax=Cetobacterium TaxID=180162 RepID=UPI00225AC2CE|nr:MULTISPECIES: diguanylate cyclase [Cetobacterium]MCX3066685.1 diguanylate cyclase [Cetobacterium somerae]